METKQETIKFGSPAELVAAGVLDELEADATVFRKETSTSSRSSSKSITVSSVEEIASRSFLTVRRETYPAEGSAVGHLPRQRASNNG